MKKKKKHFYKINFLFLFIFLIISGFCSGQKYYLFIGTYTNTGSKGIYVYSFNSKNGKVKWVSNTDSASNPSFLAISHSGKFVYAVNETGGLNPGRVSSYAFDKKGQLHFLNTAFTGGDAPCHLSTSHDDKWLSVANYSGGSTALFSLNNDGTINPFSQLIHDSIFREEDEEAKARVHETIFSPDQDFLLTPDLGLNQVMIYPFHSENKNPLDLSSMTSISSAKGSGPRHIVFHPNHQFAYLIHELDGTVTSYSYQKGNLTEIQKISTFPEGFSGKKSSAEICISPDGGFLYVSNRGDLNSLTIYSINATSGKLAFIGYQPAYGKVPRSFIIDPTGNYLVVANQNTNNIVFFKRNRKTGLLTKTKKEINIPKPVCVIVMKKS